MSKFATVKKIDGGSLKIDQVYADISVAFHQHDFTLITFDSHDKPEFLQKKDVMELEIGLPGVEKKKSYNNISFCTTDGREDITIDGVKLDSDKKIKISIVLPISGANLSFGQYVFGSVNFTENGDELSLNNAGYANIEAGNFKVLKAQLSGSGNLSLEQTTKELLLSNSGRGNFRITFASGHNSFSSSGSGNIFSLGITGKLLLESSGRGEIKAKRVDLKTASIIMSGSGNVNLGDGIIDKLSLNSADRGNFIFTGIAKVETFNLSGSGSVKINEMEGDFRLQISNRADLEAVYVNLSSFEGDISGSGTVNLGYGTIKDCRGLSISGESKFVFGNVVKIKTDRKFYFSGSGSVFLGKLIGKLNLNISDRISFTVATSELTSAIINHCGSGNIDLGSGQINNLVLGVHSRGGLEFQGNAKLESVSITGSGNVAISKMTGSPEIQITDRGGLESLKVDLEKVTVSNVGSGNVIFEAGRIDRLTVDNHDRGSFEFGGLTNIGLFAVNSSGHIYVKTCLQVLRQDKNGRGSIKIG